MLNSYFEPQKKNKVYSNEIIDGVQDLDSDFEAIVKKLYDLDCALESSYTILYSLPGMGSTTKTGAEAIIEILNTQLIYCDVEVSLEGLFYRNGEKFIPSMEGINITWKDIFKIVYQAVIIIVNSFRRYIDNRFSLTGLAYQKVNKLKTVLSELMSRNMIDTVPVRVTKDIALFIQSNGKIMPAPQIEMASRSLLKGLKPDGYRKQCEYFLTVAESYDTTTSHDYIPTLKNARNGVIRELKEYLMINELKPTRDGAKMVGTSNIFYGAFLFSMEVDIDNLQAPRVSLQEVNTGKKIPSDVFSLNKTDAGMLIDSVKNGLEGILDLRQMFDEYRAYSQKVINAAKSLKEKDTTKVMPSEVEAVHRALPGYLRIYNIALKVKSDMVYKSSVSLLRYIAASRSAWMEE